LPTPWYFLRGIGRAGALRGFWGLYGGDALHQPRDNAPSFGVRLALGAKLLPERADEFVGTVVITGVGSF